MLKDDNNKPRRESAVKLPGLMTRVHPDHFGHLH